MSETADELKDAGVEDQAGTVPEPQIEPESTEQTTWVVAEAEDETADQTVVVDNNADSGIENAAETSGAADEGASVETPQQETVSETVESHEAESGIADFVIVAIFSFLLGLLLCLPTFLGSSGTAGVEYDLSGGVAASVNGVEIGENDVTAYVTSFRMAQGLEDDNAWGQWMVDNGYSPEMLRSDTVEYFATRELLSQAVKEEGIEVSDADVDAQLASIAEQIGGEDALSEGLAAQGITLESYRESIALSLQQEALVEKVSANSELLSDDVVLETLKMYFPDEVPEDATSLDGLDASMVENARMWLKQQAFSDWMDERHAQASITVNDMPEGLPYAVDISGFEPTANDAGLLEAAPELLDEAQEDEGAKS